MSMFHEVSFPRTLGAGCTFGPSYSTDVVTMPNGAEQRNVNWSYPRCSGTINLAPRKDADFYDLLRFFHNRQGRAYGFRFYDYLDHTGTFEVIGWGDGKTTTFKLKKNYVDDIIGICQQRKIVKPIAETTRVFFKPYTEDTAAEWTWREQIRIRTEWSQSIPSDAEQRLNWSVDNTKGVITFTEAPAEFTAVIASYEFEVPVRFDTDDMRNNWELVDITAWTSIPIVELKFD